MKRVFDILFSFLGIIILSPVFLIIAIIIKADSKGPVIYKQVRVGRSGKDFSLLKFRTMRTDSDKEGLLTVGGRDSRITKSGYNLRKYKADEFPQLINVFKGDMSFVGPRPEVRKYVNLYSESQRKVLDVRPGITDIASIKYRNENELLESSKDPENYYINEIMPDKIRLNLEYLKNRSFFKDLKIIFQTFGAIVK
ncbi:MAG TPA: sugar transferase [Ignavibacteria bacterium]|nr:sugar transferase [Ignavibacteria bacterium]